MNCECTQDGQCPRYGREMAGRLREICRGENVDAGTAAQYRALWLSQKDGQPVQPNPVTCPHGGDDVRLPDGSAKTRDCATCGGLRPKVFYCHHPARELDEVTGQDCQQCAYKPRDVSKARRLILKNYLSPGDVLVMSAAIYSLHKAHPGKFVTAVDTSCPAIWEHNPDVVPADMMRSVAEVVEAHYPLINSSNQTAVHFMEGYARFLEDVLGVRIPLATNRPMLYLSKREKTWMDQVHELTGRHQKFWLVNAGKKWDFTTKFWGSDRFQAVVDSLRGKVLFVQIGEASHHHPPLKNVLNLVGKTDLRQAIRLCYHAQGGLGGVTFLQHAMAAFEKPYVCILGGREAVQWTSYPRQQLMHTIGAMPCCHDGGCWRSRVVALPDGDEKNNSLCTQPVIGDEPVGRCMTMIEPADVKSAILRYVG